MRARREFSASGPRVDGGRHESARPDVLLRLQRSAGNAAVSSLLAREGDRGPVVQRASATMRLGQWNAKAPPDGRYNIELKAMTTDVVGHAWISIAQLYEPFKRITVGFWPKGVAGVVFGSVGAGPGELESPDPHDSEENHSESATIEHDGLVALLKVVNAYESAPYSLTMNICATFAGTAWQHATGRELTYSGDWRSLMWSPAALGLDIDKDNRARGMDPVDRPLPDGG